MQNKGKVIDIVRENNMEQSGDNANFFGSAHFSKLPCEYIYRSCRVPIFDPTFSITLLFCVLAPFAV